ncbi:hypothetical protein DSO57_1005940 [Entomophthora muscae]|uniref:Uncharacterized protein n=1 Tax=Entomophthora muscae TaxID=34485 RepID=A0ACC2RZ03_9FUNG|nr:hypothetical protein DSO57_1005940 [Entomophthora muscae]
MNHLIFTAVLTACLGIGGYQQGPEFFGPFSDGLGHDPYYNPGQLNSSQTGPWPPLVSPHSMLSIAMYTSIYYVLTYFARSFERFNVHAKLFRWLMTVYPIITALTDFQLTNLLLYMLQVVPTISGYYSAPLSPSSPLFPYPHPLLPLLFLHSKVILLHCMLPCFSLHPPLKLLSFLGQNACYIMSTISG